MAPLWAPARAGTLHRHSRAAETAQELEAMTILAMTELSPAVPRGCICCVEFARLVVRSGFVQSAGTFPSTEGIEKVGGET